jgi:hypothetical protein
LSGRLLEWLSKLEGFLGIDCFTSLEEYGAKLFEDAESVVEVG